MSFTFWIIIYQLFSIHEFFSQIRIEVISLLNSWVCLLSRLPYFQPNVSLFKWIILMNFFKRELLLHCLFDIVDKPGTCKLTLINNTSIFSCKMVQFKCINIHKNDSLVEGIWTEGWEPLRLPKQPGYICLFFLIFKYNYNSRSKHFGAADARFNNWSEICVYCDLFRRFRRYRSFPMNVFSLLQLKI